MKALNWIFSLLVIIGAINWGLVGLFNFNLVTALLGSLPMVARAVFVLVGISGVWMLFNFSKCCK